MKIYVLCFCSVVFISCQQVSDQKNIGTTTGSDIDNTVEQFNTSNNSEQTTSAMNYSEGIDTIMKTKDLLVLNKEIYSKNNQEFHYSLISPNGKYTLVSYEGYIGLEIYKTDDGLEFASISKTDRIGYGAQWSLDSKKIYYKEKNTTTRKTIVKCYELENGKTSILDNIDPNSLQSYVLATQNSDPIITLNTQTLALEISPLDKSSKKTIAAGDRGGYYQPMLSPDKTKMVAHIGNKMVLVDIATQYETELDNGIATCWLPNSEKFIYFMDESKDGHEISGSDVYIYDLKTKTKQNITNTKDIIEMWPSITLDGKTMSCVNEKTGKILIYTLQL